MRAGQHHSGNSYGSCEGLKEEDDEEEQKVPPLDWESNGTVFNLCISTASGAAGHVFLLVTLVANLQACKDTFMLCNQQDTPGLRNYGEVLLCHYTKGFVFCFPAMATAVLLLLFGRNLLQQRLYYGFLKAGGVLSFSENTPWKDPLFVAMLFAFCHSIGYTVLHVIVLKRSDHFKDDMQDFLLDSSGASAIAANHTALSSTAPTDIGASSYTTLAVEGAKMLMMLLLGGPKLGVKPSGVTRSSQSSQMEGGAMGFEGYLETFMVLVATFLETTLLCIFFYCAYDITSTLVPMSEYLDSYEVREDVVRDRLYSFKDTVAKETFEHSPQIISSVDGDIHGVYTKIVEKSVHERSQSTKPSPEEPLEEPLEPIQRQLSLTEQMQPSRLGSVGLIRSLWPAELLMRRDIKGKDPKTFRRVWLVYSVLSMFWLLQVFLVLVAQGCWATMRLLNKEIEQVVPISIIMLHGVCVVMAMFVFAESLSPLAFTESLMGSDKDS